MQWSGVEFWQPDGPGVLPKSGDFQVLIWNEPGPGPEIYFTYNNMFEPLNNDIEAIFGPFVSGVENSTGTAGTAYEGPFPTGLIVCMDYDGPNNDPRPLLFSATVADDKDAKVEVKHSVDNPGSDEEKEKLKIEVSKNKGKGKDKGKKDKS